MYFKGKFYYTMLFYKNKKDKINLNFFSNKQIYLILSISFILYNFISFIISDVIFEQNIQKKDFIIRANVVY